MTEDAHCRRGALTVEHVMPQSWQQHWPLNVTDDVTDDEAAAERDDLIHTLGNLTLITGKLNPYVSNNPWLSTTNNGKPVHGKRDALNEHSILRLNNRLITHHPDAWTETDIRARTHQLAEQVAAIWPGPRHRP